MPHKHTRRKGDDDSNYNLAPSTLAKPLPTHGTLSKTTKKQPNAFKRKRVDNQNGYKHNDTPRAFRRLMQLQTSKKRQRSALDDADDTRSSQKKRKTPQPKEINTQLENGEPQQEELPKIQRGERLADFAARVDQAFPLGGLKTKGRTNVPGLKERQTHKEKKMQKMYAAWREEDTKRKAKLEEQRELEEDAAAELDGQDIAFPASNRSKKRRGRQKDDDEDPWAQLKAKREERKGLHDVVQAPPRFEVKPRERFKVRDGARVVVGDVPAAAGSLSRREELKQERAKVIDMMRRLKEGRS